MKNSISSTRKTGETHFLGHFLKRLERYFENIISQNKTLEKARRMEEGGFPRAKRFHHFVIDFLVKPSRVTD